jgi:outer membrane protein OmpA-like peptidoglycan-associated protein
MNRLLAAFVALALCAPFTHGAHAASGPEEPGEGFSRPWLFGGLDFGYAGMGVTRESAFESGKSGFQFDLKLLGSVYWPKWVADLGIGWQYDKISGSIGNSTDTQIITRAGFAELGVRRRFGDRWSLGPTLNWAFGTDLTFAPAVLSSGKQSALFGGVQFFYELPLDFTRLRLGARAMTDLDVSDRQVWLAQLSLQIGLPLGGKTPYEKVEDEGPEPDVKVNLDVNLVHFETASSKLQPQTDQVLGELGRQLAKNSGIWDRLRVDGHTDERGSYRYNLNLSQNRATEVKDAIARGGAESKRLIAKGWSFTKPLVKESNEAAWTKNRRVELRFYGVRNPAKLKEIIDSIKTKLQGVSMAPGR